MSCTINIRTTAAMRAKIDWAAAALGKSRSAFILEASTARALEILAAAARSARDG
jgi:uncharacterized protein (DUF1778 family)